MVVSLFRTSSRNHEPMGRCSAGAAECATTKTSDPTTAGVAVCRPNDRVDVEVRRVEEGLASHSSSFPFPPLSSSPSRSRCTSSPCSAERYAPRSGALWNTPRVYQLKNDSRRRVRAHPNGHPNSSRTRVDQVSVTVIRNSETRVKRSLRYLENRLNSESDEFRANSWRTSKMIQ